MAIVVCFAAMGLLSVHRYKLMQDAVSKRKPKQKTLPRLRKGFEKLF